MHKFIKIHVQECFIAALFIIALIASKTLKQKQPKFLSTVEWINKLWTIPTVEYYMAKKTQTTVPSNNMDEFHNIKQGS